MSVKWQPWGKKAFAEAKKTKRPVLLSLNAVWCHWCHTMDRETYGNNEIAKFISKHFVPVRVDTDARPDINDRYNVGGWPSTLVLTAKGDAVSGATYVPPQHMVGFLEEAIKRWKEYKPIDRKPVSVSSLDVSPKEIYRSIVEHFDPENGGFGLEPKLPHHDVLEYLLWRVYSLKDTGAKRMLERTFEGMLGGELVDHVGGGFFRYATQKDWSMPHFEKMLEDNARLLGAYFHAYRLFGKKEYLDVVNKTMFFLMTMLYDYERGVFFGSQGADEKYCKLTLNARFRKPQPFIDKRIFVDQNATMALTLFELAQMDREYADGALRILEFLSNNVKDGVPHVVGEKTFMLRDTVYLLLALLQAFAWTKDDGWRLRALVVAKHLMKFYDVDKGGFFDAVPSKAAIGRLKFSRKPVAENALAALGLHALGSMVKSKKYVVMAHKSLQAVSAQALALGPYAGLYALAKSVVK